MYLHFFYPLHFYTQEGNQESSVGHYQHGHRTEVFNASYHIKLRFHQRSPGSHLLSQSSSCRQRNQRGEDEDHLQVPAKGQKNPLAPNLLRGARGRPPDIKDKTRPFIPSGLIGQDLLVESVV